MGTKFLGTICPWGLNMLGTVCPEGTNQLGTNCGGSNVRGPYMFGTKCVTALILCNLAYLAATSSLYISFQYILKRQIHAEGVLRWLHMCNGAYNTSSTLFFWCRSTLPRRLGNNDATSHHHLHHGGGGSRPRIDAFDAHHHNHHQPHHQPQRHQRARSLEHILDGGDHHRGHGTSGGNTHGGPNYWVASGATLAVSRPKKTGRSGGEGSRHTSRAPSVENMMDESSLDTNSTSIPSYCTMDRRSRGANPQAPNSVGTSRHQPSHYRPKSRPIPISSDESSDIGVRPLSVPPNRRIYKVNSFQRPQGTMSMVFIF